MGEGSRRELIQVYTILLDKFGSQGWWPADTSFETIIGAILAQNVSWIGAHKAVSNLKNSNLMDPHILISTDNDYISHLIRSSRYHNQKTLRIKTFLNWLIMKCNGNLSLLDTERREPLRKEMLNLNGFGPETVDSILLYAFNKLTFVVDAYTRRIGERQGWFNKDYSYSDIQTFFMKRLSPDLMLYNDFHAQLVNLGNQICRKNPECSKCPILKDNGRIYCIYGNIIIKEISHDL
jgi:endonuclease III related protein